MKRLTQICSILFATLVTVNAMATSSGSKNFIASSVVIRDVMNKNLLQSHAYDAAFEAALERDAGTSISGLTDCEPSAGTFGCSLSVQTTKGASIVLFVSINNGNVLSAEIQ